MKHYKRFFSETSDFYNNKKINSSINKIITKYSSEDIVSGKIDKSLIDEIYPLVFDFSGQYLKQITKNLAKDLNLEYDGGTTINDDKLESIVYFLQKYNLSKKSFENISNLEIKVGNKYKQILVVGGILQDHIYKNVIISRIDSEGNVSLTFGSKVLTAAGDRLKLL